MLSITLEESDCFQAWVSVNDVGLSSPGDTNSDTKGVWVSCGHRCFYLVCFIDGSIATITFIVYLLAEDKAGYLYTYKFSLE